MCPRVLSTVQLILPSHSLPPLTERIMRQEAARIWAREGVALIFLTTEREGGAGVSAVRLSFLGEVDGSYRDKPLYTLGDFLRDEQRIRVSLTAASRTVAQGRAAARGPQAPFVSALTLGYVLGRAVAHEVGHVLLGTAHSETGLMTAAFAPAAMVDVKSTRFQLDRGDAARLFVTPPAATVADAGVEATDPLDAGALSSEPADTADGGATLAR
jgi:hypothetical protein